MSEQDENTGASEVVELAIQLDPIEARILGSLIEKQATTPDTYPLTLNAVVSACNQKSNRDPATEFETGEVGHALRQLEGKGLVSGTLSARASRYAHRFDKGYNVTSRQRAVLSLLLLRGPQTLNELYIRSERLTDFPDADEVRHVLERLLTRSPAMVVNLGRGSGQREDRYMHLLCGPVSADTLSYHAIPAASASSSEPRGGLADRVSQLESLVAAMQEEITELRSRLPLRNDV